jgi:biopolymer transport protein ExbD
MRVQRGERRKARIEIIPLIDVTFLLLVFFIYLSLFMTLERGIPLLLPQAVTSLPQRSQNIEVSVDQRGFVYVEKERVGLLRLGERVRELMQARRAQGVSLRGDRRVTYQRLMEVLDELREAGVEKVTLVAEEET